VKELIRDQRGFVTVLLLILIPLLLVAAVGSTETARLNSGSNIDVQGALDQAVKAAAMCVDPSSQANGDPRIDPDKAHAQFRYYLAANLKLDSSLNPVQGSRVTETPAYTFVVVNGANDYVPEGRVYSCDGVCSENDFVVSLPQTFSVSDDIYIGSGGLRDITVKSPTCIALVKSRVKPVFTDRSDMTARWSASRIIVRSW